MFLRHAPDTAVLSPAMTPAPMTTPTTGIHHDRNPVAAARNPLAPPSHPATTAWPPLPCVPSIPIFDRPNLKRRLFFVASVFSLPASRSWFATIHFSETLWDGRTTFFPFFPILPWTAPKTPPAVTRRRSRRQEKSSITSQIPVIPGGATLQPLA